MKHLKTIIGIILVYFFAELTDTLIYVYPVWDYASDLIRGENRLKDATGAVNSKI